MAPYNNTCDHEARLQSMTVEDGDETIVPENMACPTVKSLNPVHPLLPCLYRFLFSSSTNPTSFGLGKNKEYSEEFVPGGVE